MSDLRLTALTVAVAAARHGRLVNILAGGVASSAVYTSPGQGQLLCLWLAGRVLDLKLYICHPHILGLRMFCSLFVSTAPGLTCDLMIFQNISVVTKQSQFRLLVCTVMAD